MVLLFSVLRAVKHQWSMAQNMKSFQWIAHRGASHDAPENTKAAFDLACALGADQIECDIAFSKDGIPCIFHDDSLERTTNGEGLLANQTWSELQKLDAGLWFSNKYRGEKILSLAQLLAWKQEHPKLRLNLEVKAIVPAAIAQKMDLILSMLQGQDNIILSSFQAAILQYLKLKANQTPRAFLVERWSQSAVFLAKSLHCEQINVGDPIIRSSMIHLTHQQGLKFGVYTVNNRYRFRRLIVQGVDAIFTDKCKLGLKSQLKA